MNSSSFALSPAALLICTLAVWQSSICSERINSGGADGSPYRYYATHAKSISADRDAKTGVLCYFLGSFLPLISALTLREISHFSLRSYIRLTDSQEISIKASTNRGKCCQLHRTKARAVQEVCVWSQRWLFPCSETSTVNVPNVEHLLDSSLTDVRLLCRTCLEVKAWLDNWVK